MEERGVAWNGRAEDRFSVNDLFVIAREVKFAFSNSDKPDSGSGRIFSPPKALLLRFYPPRKENEIHPLKNNPIKHSSSGISLRE